MESPGRTQKFEEKKIDLKLFPDHFFNATMTLRWISAAAVRSISGYLANASTEDMQSVEGKSLTYNVIVA